VQAKDRSGNFSGAAEYKITFEVINKPSITHVLNYPNPFSTSTRFMFTLTGSQVPDYFKIQIMTVTGKVVREINRSELGLIHIGRNITEYAWDGKDEFGDQLANGIYLYRVLTQLDGKSLELRETTADSYFTQGFGKMYLMR
jgi:flagellar hook assembly protein FlgD